MGILGIENRTENWKTATYLVPLKMKNNGSTLADRLTRNLSHRSVEPELELFWRGMRDFLSKNVLDPAIVRERVARIYKSHFDGLREDIIRFGGFRALQPQNYDASSPERQLKLFKNVYNTEVDIVLEDSDCLFIGEAKHEMGFGANGTLILVHQLVRQYVMARILVELSVGALNKKVVPFVVGDNVGKLRKTNQVKFMISQGWLQEGNVLSWQEIKEIARRGVS